MKRLVASCLAVLALSMAVPAIAQPEAAGGSGADDSRLALLFDDWLGWLADLAQKARADVTGAGLVANVSEDDPQSPTPPVEPNEARSDVTGAG